MIPRLARKAALLIGATAVAGSAFVAMPTPASAAQQIPPVVSLPYCVQVNDSPGRAAEFCLNSVNTVSIAGTTTSEAVTGRGSLKVCTSTWACSSVPVTLNASGAGINPNGAVPTLTYTGSTVLHLTV